MLWQALCEEMCTLSSQASRLVLRDSPATLESLTLACGDVCRLQPSSDASQQPCYVSDGAKQGAACSALQQALLFLLPQLATGDPTCVTSATRQDIYDRCMLQLRGIDRLCVRGEIAALAQESPL